MKTITIPLNTCILVVCMLASFRALAQQPSSKKAGGSPQQMQGRNASYNYTYQVFQAPNKMFGFDIFQNGKGVFHQPAVIVSPNNVSANQRSALQDPRAGANDHGNTPAGFSKNEFAESAALLSIDKIKQGLGPVLTSEEMKQVFVSTTSVTKKQ
jgi:hypothetical protein